MEKGEISKQQYDAAKANSDASASSLVADEQRLAQAQRLILIARAQTESRQGPCRSGQGWGKFALMRTAIGLACVLRMRKRNLQK